METHSSVLAWRIPGTGEPGGLLSLGLHRVGHRVWQQQQPKSLRTVTAAMKLKDACSLEEKLDSILKCRDIAAAAKSLQSCPTLCDPIDGSPPGSPILRIL